MKNDILSGSNLRSAPVLKDQAVMLLLENKLQEALRKMSQAIDHDPTVAEFHVLRGSINRNDL